MSAKGIIAVLSALSVTALGSSALAQDNPYPAHSQGYDISYPQCGTSLPSDGTFWAAGVNNGRPFTQNGCLLDQINATPSNVLTSYYFNVGYDRSYASKITPFCANHNVGTAPPEYIIAWKIGCSEAQVSSSIVKNIVENRILSSWWLDVETANSWSDSVELNRWTIRGAIDYFQQQELATVGIYSAQNLWTQIAGKNWSPPEQDIPDWMAGADLSNPSAYCSQPFSANSPVWLTQAVDKTRNLDIDYICPQPVSKSKDRPKIVTNSTGFPTNPFWGIGSYHPQSLQNLPNLPQGFLGGCSSSTDPYTSSSFYSVFKFIC
jgi:hypothetical protein